MVSSATADTDMVADTANRLISISTDSSTARDLRMCFMRGFLLFILHPTDAVKITKIYYNMIPSISQYKL